MYDFDEISRNHYKLIAAQNVAINMLPRKPGPITIDELLSRSTFGEDILQAFVETLGSAAQAWTNVHNLENKQAQLLENGAVSIRNTSRNVSKRKIIEATDNELGVSFAGTGTEKPAISFVLFDFDDYQANSQYEVYRAAYVGFDNGFDTRFTKVHKDNLHERDWRDDGVYSDWAEEVLKTDKFDVALFIDCEAARENILHIQKKSGVPCFFVTRLAIETSNVNIGTIARSLMPHPEPDPLFEGEGRSFMSVSKDLQSLKEEEARFGPVVSEEAIDTELTGNVIAMPRRKVTEPTQFGPSLTKELIDILMKDERGEHIDKPTTKVVPPLEFTHEQKLAWLELAGFATKSSFTVEDK